MYKRQPVNRLDRNTTGLVIFGKNSEALRKLTAVIRRRDGIEKYYMTIVCGCLKQPIVLEDRLVKDQGRNISQIANGNRGKEDVYKRQTMLCLRSLIMAVGYPRIKLRLCLQVTADPASL